MFVYNLGSFQPALLKENTSVVRFDRLRFITIDTARNLYFQSIFGRAGGSALAKLFYSTWLCPVACDPLNHSGWSSGFFRKATEYQGG